MIAKTCQKGKFGQNLRVSVHWLYVYRILPLYTGRPRDGKLAVTRKEQSDKVNQSRWVAGLRGAFNFDKLAMDDTSDWTKILPHWRDDQ